ncbi:GUN4 domain-containing protein [Synechococcus sp. RedBA-s]|uniref:GUN4 domain-containing protein n=1 Tax=Synechococcus sp. RedBA-s TaxID=2823741 RepID=UPI0020CD9D31|nr:GUN4 domain-containing protein [Synechococcus sp. RedBA-s]MCP9799341.1 GUN4 domain-containing protein [Synechococcus sp. RedBA-s]
MNDLEQRVQHLEQQIMGLSSQLQELQQTLLQVGDVQRFSRLRALLSAGDLDAADLETAHLLFDELAGPDGDICPESLERCPAGPLQIIDALWRSSTGNHQGFTVQQRLYRDLGGSRESLIAQDHGLFHQFTQRVGWPLVEGVGFAMPEDLTVPVATALDTEGALLEGHLPVRCWATDYGLKAANLLMARLIEVFAD